MQGFVRIDLGALYPPFAKTLLQLQTNCAIRGVHYYITSGTRGEVEQNRLYAQGRMLPGPIVTNSKFGKSAHNFGIGADVTHDSDLTKPGLQSDWMPEHYTVLGEEASKLSLEWGGNWTSFKDMPHVQWKLPPGLLLSDLFKAYQGGGLSAAWKLLDLANAS